MARVDMLVFCRDTRDTMNTSITPTQETDMATSIRLPAELEHRINSLAKVTGRTKSFYILEMIERGIDDMEDYYLGAEVLERVRKGEEEIFSAEEMRRDLGLES